MRKVRTRLDGAPHSLRGLARDRRGSEQSTNPGPAGVIAAFHAPAPDPQVVAAALASRLPGRSSAELNTLAALDWPGILFRTSPFTINGSNVQISPCDERCVAGEVPITPDASGRFVETSEELFMLRQVF